MQCASSWVASTITFVSAGSPSPAEDFIEDGADFQRLLITSQLRQDGFRYGAQPLMVYVQSDIPQS